MSRSQGRDTLYVLVIGFGRRVLPETAPDMDKIASISQQLLQFSPDALIVVDFQGVILFANATSRALFGYSREQLVGQSIDMLVPGPLSLSSRRACGRLSSRPHRAGNGSAHH